MSGDKTEDPTPKRLRKAKEDGNVAKSSEFTGVVVMVASIAVLIFWMDTVVERLGASVVSAIQLATRPDISKQMAEPFLMQALKDLSWILFPLLGTTFVMAAFIMYVQVGSLFTMKPLKPDPNKLNPVNGFKNMFSKDKAVDLLKNVLKLSVMTAIGYSVLSGNIAPILKTPRVSLIHGMEIFSSVALDLGSYLVGGLIAFGVFDMWWQRHQWWEKLKMSKKEVKDEHKNTEGDPHVKQKRKQKHKELINDAGGSADAVKDADAVVANPSHVAVALRYREDEMNAPNILTAGKGVKARKIKRLARRYQVPIVRNVELARSLFDCEVDEAIPAEFYEPVAEVLRYVYQLQEENQTA